MSLFFLISQLSRLTTSRAALADSKDWAGLLAPNIIAYSECGVNPYLLMFHKENIVAVIFIGSSTHTYLFLKTLCSFCGGSMSVLVL